MSKLHIRTEHGVPEWSGFVSLTRYSPKQKTPTDYYPFIFSPITEFKTVKECLCQTENATLEVGQQFVITTFDLGVCMKTYPLVWNQPECYQLHIIVLVTFHLACTYMKMTSKKMIGSGLRHPFGSWVNLSWVSEWSVVRETE